MKLQIITSKLAPQREREPFVREDTTVVLKF